MEESLDSFLLNAIPVNREEDKCLVHLTVKIFSVPSCRLIYQESLNPVERIISLYCEGVVVFFGLQLSPHTQNDKNKCH